MSKNKKEQKMSKETGSTESQGLGDEKRISKGVYRSGQATK
jgi:hypothetical protein